MISMFVPPSKVAQVGATERTWCEVLFLGASHEE